MIFPAPQPILTTSLTGGVLARSLEPQGALQSHTEVEGEAPLSGGFAERLEASEAQAKPSSNPTLKQPTQGDAADALAALENDAPDPRTNVAALPSSSERPSSLSVRTPETQLSSFDEPPLPSASGGKGLPQPGADLPLPASASPIETASRASAKAAQDTNLAGAGKAKERLTASSGPLVKGSSLTAFGEESEPVSTVASRAREEPEVGPVLPNSLARSGKAGLEDFSALSPGERADSTTAPTEAPPEPNQPLAKFTDKGAQSATPEPGPVNPAATRAQTPVQTQSQQSQQTLVAPSDEGQVFAGVSAPDRALGTDKSLTPPPSLGAAFAEAETRISEPVSASDASASKALSAPGGTLAQSLQPAAVPGKPNLATASGAGAKLPQEPDGLPASLPGRSTQRVESPNLKAANGSNASPAAAPTPDSAAPSPAKPKLTSPLIAPLAEAEPVLPASPATLLSALPEPSLASLNALSSIAQTTAPLAAPVSVSPPSAPSAATAPFASVSNSASTTAEIVEQVTQQVSEAREAGRSVRPELTVRHSDFGTVAMRIEPGVGGAASDWRATLSARDPGFVPAAQAALVERGVSATGESASTQNGFSQGGGSQSGFQGGSSQRGSDTHPQSGPLQNGAGFGASSGGSDQRYGSSTGSGQGSAQPYPGEEGASGRNQTAPVSDEADATSARNGQGGALFA